MAIDNEKISLLLSQPAKAKWKFLQEQGYFGFHIRSGGVVFGTREGGEAGHLSWFGRVTWVPRN